MSKEKQGFYILGVTTHGHKFRPSDWAERLASVFGSFDGRQRLRYNPLVTPARHEDQHCLFVSSLMAASNPDGYGFIMNFAAGNGLEVKITGQPDSYEPELKNVA